MAKVVLDASAVLALIRREKGADKVAPVMNDGLLSSINAAEVYSKLDEWRVTQLEHDVYHNLIVNQIVPFGPDLALATGRLRHITKPLGLSLGDRACLALALREGLPVMTADRHWTKLAIGVTIECVR